MDIFIEKIVVKKKNTFDFIFNALTIVLTVILCFVVFNIKAVSAFAPVILLALAYGAYRLIITRNIEFEYAVTNGDLDIDTIISQKKRKRIFSANCKDFEIVARVSSDHFTQDVRNLKNSISAISSKNSSNVYFVTLNYHGQRTVLYFEPDKRMLDAFKVFIPRKVFE